MAKVNLRVEVDLTRGVMRKLNPHLKRKGLTIQEAVEKGMNKRTPWMYAKLTVVLAAIQGVGLTELR